MKIAFLDLHHSTRGMHSNVVPFGIGLISAYLKKNINEPLDIRLYKETQKALDDFQSWIPDVVGISQYCWGVELNLHIASLLKQKNPDIIVIAGGPNLEMDILKRTDFLRKHRFIDFCIAYDGEIPFLQIIQRLLKGERGDDLRKNLPAGFYCIDPVSSEYLESKEPVPRLSSLDDFGPVYKEKIFEKFLDEGYHPMVQTHRGCPFSCAYCRTSDSYNSKMLFLSPEIFQQDMDYLGERYRGRSDIMLYVANTNMSLFKEDFPIAEIIRDTQKKYEWPKYIYFDTGKDTKKLLEMLDIIKYIPAPALQTLTPEVLKNINRRNIPFDDYVNFQNEAMKRTGDSTMTELILCLPGESKESFLETLRKVINSGVQALVIYTLIKLPGTPLASKEFEEKYKYILRYRVVPRQFSDIGGKRIFDTEEVIVGTKDLSYQDYSELRGLCFVITVFFNCVEFIPLKKLLKEYNIDLAQWVFDIQKKISDYPEINKYYREYLKETEEELFNSREELMDFFNREENFKSLVNGEKGDNLLRKYKHLVFSNAYSSCVDLAFTEADEAASRDDTDKEIHGMINDLKSYIETRDIKPLLDNQKVGSCYNQVLRYKIPDWLKNNTDGLPLKDFFGQFKYTVKFNEKQKEYIKKANTHKDIILSLQMLYRDGNTKDLWPEWILES